MAAPIAEYTIIEVRKPNVGENKPADVTADIVIDTSSKSQDCYPFPYSPNPPFYPLPAWGASCSACSTVLERLMLLWVCIAAIPDVPGPCTAL